MSKTKNSVKLIRKAFAKVNRITFNLQTNLLLDRTKSEIAYVNSHLKLLFYSRNLFKSY